MDALDLIYYTFIALVVLGGVACIIIFLPREHKMWDDTEDCYRVCQKNGVFTISDKKANYFESRKDYIYLKKSAFTVDGFVGGIKNETGCFKATASAMVQFPPALISISAPTFGGSNQEAIEETIGEVISAALKDAIEGGNTGDVDTFKQCVLDTLKSKLKLFGVEVLVLNDVRLSADTSVE